MPDLDPDAARCLRDVILSRVRERGSIPAAEFIELALYHPDYGYYMTAARRSGRAGDFITSVDVSALFGRSIAVQLAEVWDLLRAVGATAFDLVEAGAGDGRLARDILDAAAEDHPDLYDHLRLTLIERSEPAREAQREMLAPHADRIAALAADLSGTFTGVILANELLDALPPHVVTAGDNDVQEVYVTEKDGTFVHQNRPLTNPAVRQHLSSAGVRLPAGIQTEVNVAASQWVSRAAASLSRGVLLLFDYGYEAQELYSERHARGTLMSCRRHLARDDGWLTHPGETDLTAHVDLTAIRRAAESAGLVTVGVVDQTYFLLALGILAHLQTAIHGGPLEFLAARTLLMPGGLGSTMKAMAFAKGLESPRLHGFSGGRLT